MLVVISFIVVGVVCSRGVVEDILTLIGASVETVVDMEIVVISAVEVVIVVVIFVVVVVVGGGGVTGIVVIAVVVVVVVRVVVVEMAFVCCIVVVVVKGPIVVGCCGHLSPIKNNPDEQKQVMCDVLLIEMKFDCSSEHKASCGPQIPGLLHIPINNK